MPGLTLQVSVEGVSPDQYLERFSWNEAKYPPRRPLSETVSAITETIQRLEDDLKVVHIHACTHYWISQCHRERNSRVPFGTSLMQSSWHAGENE